MRFVLVEAGRFLQGSPTSLPGREAGETLHEVTLSRSFFISTTEVTQAQWERVTGERPSVRNDCDDCPVENVTWHAARRFLDALSRRTGRTFRLPTEAEWEYAARAGTTTAFPTGEALSRKDANVDGSPGSTRPVGSYPPNAWGLYDVSGNVWEWCADDFCPYPGGPVTDPLGSCSSGLKVIRGGAYSFDVNSARAALRFTHAPADKGPGLGFRAVCETD